MSENYIKLYSASSAVESAFLLTEGSVFFYASNADKYAITGKNLIIGSTEIIMNNIYGNKTMRIETAVADPASIIKKLAADKFLAGLKTYSFALNVSMVLAKQVMLSNQIIQKNIAALKGDEIEMKDNSITYYTIISRLQEEYNKRKLPWLKSLIQEYCETITYRRGEAYYKSAEPAKILNTTGFSDKDAEFPKGSLLCEENTMGNEMFILKSGSIDVIIKGNKITSIDDPGTVIGETALLLGEMRTATLKAKNTVIVSRIRKEDLQGIAQKQTDFLPNIAQTLAKRHYYNISKIDGINKSIAEQNIERDVLGKKQVFHSHRTFKDLRKLQQVIEDIIREKKADFLKDLTDSFK